MSASRFSLLVSALMILSAAPAVSQDKNLGGHFQGDSPFRAPRESRIPEGELEEIRARMLERGAMDRRDREVLGPFWGLSPLEESGTGKKDAAASLGYEEYLQIIQTRCILCHERDRIGKAIEEQLPFLTMEEIMLKRQVILTPWEREVMKTFWGTPLK